MARSRGVVALAAITVFAVVATACGDDDDTSDAKSTTTTAAEVADRGNVNGGLEIGHLAPQTGQLAAIASSITVPVQMAVDEINAAGGVNGKDLKLSTRDDGADATVTSAALDALLESDKVDAVVGPASSPSALGIIDKIKTAGVLTCSGSNTSAALSTADSGGFYFRTAPPDRFQGPALAEVVIKDGYSKPGIIVRNDAYGVGFGNSLKKALNDGGATVAGKVVAYDPNGTNFDADVQRVIDAGPDSIVVLGFNDDGAKIISTMIAKDVGPADIPVYTADGMQGSTFGETVDPANPGVVSGMKGTAPAAAPAGVESPFNAKYAATNLPPIFSSYYYDCVLLTALAAQKAKSDDPAKMKAAFAENLIGETDCNTYADCKTALEAGETIHYHGASQSFENWAESEPDQGVYEIWSYDDAAEVVTQPPETQITIS